MIQRMVPLLHLGLANRWLKQKHADNDMHTPEGTIGNIQYSQKGCQVAKTYFGAGAPGISIKEQNQILHVIQLKNS
jgi:hypothetical protein